MLKIHEKTEQDRFTGFAAISINSMEAFPYKVRVSAIPFNIWWRGHQRPVEQTEYAAAISFESDEEAVVRVRFSDRTITEKSDIVIRPLSKKVGCSADGGEINLYA